MRFQMRQLLAIIGVACFLLGAAKIFLTFPTPPSFQIVICVLLMIAGPMIAYAGAVYFEGAGRAFFVSGALAAIVPWILLMIYVVGLAPQALAMRTAEEASNSGAPPYIIMLALAPWLIFIAGGAVGALLHFGWRQSRKLLQKLGLISAHSSRHSLRVLD
jgi:hypothetical protein